MCFYPLKYSDHFIYIIFETSSWQKNKDHHINLLIKMAKLATHLETTMVMDMLSTLMEISIAEIMKKDKGLEKESTFMLTAIATMAHLSVTKSMELEDLLLRTKDNTMVHLHLFRTMGKWGQTWRRNIYIC